MALRTREPRQSAVEQLGREAASHERELQRSTSATDGERELLRRVNGSAEHPRLADLTPDALRSVTRRHGIDYATALLYDRLVRSSEQGPFIQRVEGLMSRSEGFRGALEATLVVVPGAFFEELSATGGDGELLRHHAGGWGCRIETAPIASMGSLAENAARLNEWLIRQSTERVILASFSKGGSDVKVALARPDGREAFRNVVAWINISGMLDGTPMVTWLYESKIRTRFFQLAFRMRGLDFRLVRDIDHGTGRPLDFELEIPDHLKLISLVGFPLRQHLCTRLTRRWHRRMTRLGPNDGLVRLCDTCALPGSIYPVWGADHYLRPRWNIRSLTDALATYLADECDLWRGSRP